MKYSFTFLLVLLTLVQLKAQTEKYAIDIFKEVVDSEQNLSDSRKKMRLKNFEERNWTQKSQNKHHLLNGDNGGLGLLANKQDLGFTPNNSPKHSSYASVSKTVNCTAGNLSSLLTATELSTVTDLEITGTIDARDFKILRDNMPLLIALDISTVTITQYIGTLGTVNSSQVYEQNCIPQYAFRQPGWYPTTLKLASVKLPSSLVNIKEHAFECTSLSGDLTIPSSVVEIGYAAFRDLSGITHIEFGSSLKKIGSSSFNGCEGLSGILEIPSSVESIGSGAFACGAKCALVIHTNKLTKIESATFSGSFTGILSIPNSVKIIEDRAFEFCSFSGSLILPSSLEYIGDYAFMGCSEFSGLLTIPSSVKHIGIGAFSNCKNLNGLSIPNSIKKISFACFENDSSLTGNLTIPSSVDTIDCFAFSNCKELKNVNLTVGLKVIESFAFENCSGLTGLSLPEGLSKIDGEAFINCKGLRGSLKIPSTIDTVGSKSFLNCSGLDKLILSENIKVIDESAFEGCLNLDGQIVIPSTVKKIRFRAFRNTSKLDSIVIPSSLDTIESLSFWGTGGHFIVDSNNKTYSSLDGVLYNKKLNKLICCPTSIEGSFYIPLTIDTLSIGAFINCDKISSIRIPSKMSVISSGAFAICSSLRNVYVYSSIPAKLISDSFYGVNLSECTLHVPKNSKVVYSSTDVWENFTNIVEDDDIASSSSSLLTTNLSGNYIVSIYTYSNWIAFSNQPWLTVSPNSGSGNTTITLTAEANNTTNERTAIVTISAMGLPSQEIIVTQKPGVAILSVSTTSLIIGKEANSTATVGITSNTSWSATSNQAWLTVGQVSGAGDVNLILTAQANPTIIERTASVTISAAGVTDQVVLVTQQAGNATLSVSTTSLTIGKDANSTASVGVISNASWLVSTDQSWLTITPLSGTGNATLTIAAEENNTTTERTAIVTVSASGLPSQTITVKQAGKTTGIEDLTSSPISVYPNPTTHIFAVNGFDGIATVEIFNITGELKMRYSTEANKSKSVEDLTRGLYVLRISTTSGVVNRKLLIE